MSERLQYNSDVLFARGAVGIFVLLYGVCMALMMQCYVPVGDDIVYSTAMNHYAERYGAAGWPAYCAGHWISTNGRLANFLAPLFLSVFPHWFSDICVGVTYACLLILMLRCVDFKKPDLLGKSLLIGLVVLTLPWYDDLLLYDCWLNYVVAALLTLWWLRLWNCGRGSMAGLIGIGFIASMMHESCSLAVSAGLIVRLLTIQNIGNYRRALGGAIAYWVGCAVCTLSPGMMSRMADNPLAGDRFSVLFISDFYVVMLLAVVLLLCFCRNGRKRLIGLVGGQWVVFAVSALVSCIISIYSGIPGRSGFFAQIFALIALFIIVQTLRLNIPRIPAMTGGIIILSACAVQTVYALYWQSRIGAETREVLGMVKAAPDGVVFHNLKASTRKPALTLGKCVALPPRTKVWMYSMLKNEVSAGRQMLILPETFENVDFSSGHASASNDDCIILPAGKVALKDTILPSEGYAPALMYGNMLATRARIAGHDYVVLDRMP